MKNDTLKIRSELIKAIESDPASVRSLIKRTPAELADTFLNDSYSYNRARITTYISKRDNPNEFARSMLVALHEAKRDEQLRRTLIWQFRLTFAVALLTLAVTVFSVLIALETFKPA